VDARNRLVAGELERRWNEKLEEVETTKQRLSSLNGRRYSLSSEEEARIRSMGENFAESWRSDGCPPTLKKMIFRAAMEEIIVRADAENQTLQFTIHWTGGTHTQLEMERPRSATEATTPQNRVATVRRNHSILGQKRALPDPERVSLSEAARLSGVSHRTIERLVEAGLLKREQAAPRAPWEIRRADLNAEPVRGIVARLLRTGKLTLHGGRAENQPPLFAENEGDDNARHHE
jgi:hypothetical protein